MPKFRWLLRQASCQRAADRQQTLAAKLTSIASQLAICVTNIQAAVSTSEITLRVHSRDRYLQLQEDMKVLSSEAVTTK
jgi:hypothetical protein